MAQFVVIGLVTGGFLLLATLGFALVSRVEKFLNIAHAELMTVSALGTWWLSGPLGLPLVVAAIVAMIVTAVLGLVIARVVYEPMISQGPAILLIVSVGVVFVVHGAVEALVGPGVRTLPLPTLTSWRLGPVTVVPYQAGVLAAGLASVAGLHLFLTRTTTGAVIRALADDRELAEIRGVDVRRATRWVWLVASGLAGLAGVALGVLGTLTTDLAFEQILLILTVSIVAGLGSIYGVAVAAFAIGLAMDVSVVWLPPGYRTAVAFAVVILVLTFRREGVLGRAAT